MNRDSLINKFYQTLKLILMSEEVYYSITVFRDDLEYRGKYTYKGRCRLSEFLSIKSSGYYNSYPIKGIWCEFAENYREMKALGYY